MWKSDHGEGRDRWHGHRHGRFPATACPRYDRARQHRDIGPQRFDLVQDCPFIRRTLRHRLARFARHGIDDLHAQVDGISDRPLIGNEIRERNRAFAVAGHDLAAVVDLAPGASGCAPFGERGAGRGQGQGNRCANQTGCNIICACPCCRGILSMLIRHSRPDRMCRDSRTGRCCRRCGGTRHCPFRRNIPASSDR